MSEKSHSRIAVSFGNPTKLPPYEAALRAVELEPVRNPESLDGVRGLLLAGGSDIDPDLYGESREPETEEPDRQRDERESRLIHEAIDRDLPVLAICRGLQMLNVALGGTLVQHLPNAPAHQQRTSDPSQRIHDVIIASGTQLADIAGPGEHAVNSRHHQAIARLAPGLRMSAAATFDGLIEAAELPGQRFVIGVQWHPEDRIQCEADRKLFEGFARAVMDH
jgi:putative glutamine amidotransferase